MQKAKIENCNNRIKCNKIKIKIKITTRNIYYYYYNQLEDRRFNSALIVFNS